MRSHWSETLAFWSCESLISSSWKKIRTQELWPSKNIYLSSRGRWFAVPSKCVIKNWIWMLENSPSRDTEESSLPGLLVIARCFYKEYVRNAEKRKLLITLAFSQYLNSCYSSRENFSQTQWQFDNAWLQNFIVHDAWPCFTSAILLSI